MKESLLHHLNNDYTYPVRDPLWKHIYLSSGMKEIIATRDFLRLGRIRQLGPASLIYPGATHTRLNHSLGVFYLSHKILSTLIHKEGCPELSLEGVKAFLCAALLHDLGHFPHAHSFKELPLKDHEALSAEILLNGEIGKIISEKMGTNPELTASIIDTSRETKGNRELIFYRNLLSGVLDPDKLDYLTRDAYFCGVPYGIQDTDFVLDQIIPTETGLAISTKGITAIENVLFSKYLMYKTVYWHRGVRISTALVKKAVYLALREGQLKQDELYGMDDETFLTKMTSLDPSLRRLMEDSETPYSYKILGNGDFIHEDRLHQDLINLDFRLKKEEEIAQLLQRKGYQINNKEVLLDITGRISFEVELPVIGSQGSLPFPEADTLFTRQVVKDFTGGLHRIRLMIPTAVYNSLKGSSDIKEILEIIHI